MNENIKIGILEDNAVFLDALGVILEGRGFRNYESFLDLHVFMTQFDDSYDILVMDHQLGKGMTGLDIIDRIYLKNKNIFIILLSASEDFEVLLQYTNKGLERYIVKGRETMLSQIQQFLKEGSDKMIAFRKRGKEYGR